MTSRKIKEFVTAQEWRRLHLSGRPSKIAGDPELRLFVDDALERMGFMAIAAECRSRFGAARAPGKSAIGRYWYDYRSPAARRPVEVFEPKTPRAPLFPRPARKPRKRVSP